MGTLALGHYHDPDTIATVIIGTGTNAGYSERTDAIIRCQGVLTTSRGMVFNMEWGNFWSSHLPRTSYDIELDVQMIKTPLMAEMHEDDSPELTEVARILKDTLEIPDVPLKVRKLVVKVCDVVTRRAARLAAAGIVGILKKIGRDGSGGITGGRRSDIKMKRAVVAIEGGLYTSYTMFREYLREAMIEILGEEAAEHVILMVTEDGSGVGAALLAATHSSDRVDNVQLL
nr:hexokinase-3 [Quercus suber]